MTRPTNIYWLYDVRPDTIAMGWAYGYPFYCGKTDVDVYDRLKWHRDKSRRGGLTPVCNWIRACRCYIRPQIVQVVPAGEDWSKVEEMWIQKLRRTVPVCANVRDGGDTVFKKRGETKRVREVDLRDALAAIEMRQWVAQMRAG